MERGDIYQEIKNSERKVELQYVSENYVVYKYENNPKEYGLSVDEFYCIFEPDDGKIIEYPEPEPEPLVIRMRLEYEEDGEWITVFDKYQIHEQEYFDYSQNTTYTFQDKFYVKDHKDNQFLVHNQNYSIVQYVRKEGE